MFKRKYKVALVTDSIADLPKELLDKYQIHMIPLNLLIGDSNYLEKVTISQSYLHQTMDNGVDYPTSAQPTEKSVRNYLKL